MTFPEIDNLGNMLQASFVDLEVIHNLEMSKILKKAPQLTWKALHQHSLERQNVKLALKIFNDSNIAPLKCYRPDHENLENWKGMSLFISIICK